MIAPRFILLVWKYLSRYRIRSFLTLSGISTAMFLFYAVQTMQQGVKDATQESAKDTTLVVYREDRFCPFTSRLPEDYVRKIEKISGVESVVPLKIVVSNCRASLDVVTFRGVPENAFETGLFKDIQLLQGSIATWKKRSDAALMGEHLALKRGLKVGDRLEVAGIAITVAGILRSTHPQDQNVAYTHLSFIQRSAKDQIGVVTQFNVKIKDPSALESIAEEIDSSFAHSPEPTSTWTEKAFVARAASDIIEIVHFTQWLGWGALLAVFALVANAIILSVQDRIRDHAVLQTLGYTDFLIARLIIAESLLLSLIGASLGMGSAFLFLQYSPLSFSIEGLNIPLHPSLERTLIGFALSFIIGILAGLVPAWQATHRETADCFRAV
jgi:putative ABC transport system permease protein